MIVWNEGVKQGFIQVRVVHLRCAFWLEALPRVCVIFGAHSPAT